MFYNRGEVLLSFCKKNKRKRDKVGILKGGTPNLGKNSHIFPFFLSQTSLMQIIENRNWQGQLCNGLIPLNLCTPSSVRLDCHIIRPVYRRRALMYTIWCIASPAFSGTSPSPSQSIAHFWCQFLHLVFASHGAVFLGIWCFDAAGCMLSVNNNRK